MFNILSRGIYQYPRGVICNSAATSVTNTGGEGRGKGNGEREENGEGRRGGRIDNSISSAIKLFHARISFTADFKSVPMQSE